ncbi:MAG: bifunctional phosphoglucose/phosphomannose isomerase [Armatimonadetes bacterium]|nr:bifunctional phosphoglucose/phosphomannose isomerase [Armatimonadota bacterium]
MPNRLDDPAFVLRNDPKGMMGLTMGFPDQCRKALSIASSASLNDSLTGCDQIVVAGVGGSAAGGDFLRALFEAFSKTPCFVLRDYALPTFVNERTLVIACSYSGNTEETLTASAEALGRGCKMLAVTSGGALLEVGAKEGFPVIKVQAGQPPRTALGFLFVPPAVACVRLGYLPELEFEAAFVMLDSCVERWGVQARANPAKVLAGKLFETVPLIYGLGPWQGIVANRWKSQINENSKTMAFANTFPELNHNEIMGWSLADRQGVSKWATVILENGDESKRMQERSRVTQEIFSGKGEAHVVRAEGSSLLTQMLTLTFFGDLVSLYMAALYGIDPEAIDSINALKKALSELH